MSYVYETPVVHHMCHMTMDRIRASIERDASRALAQLDEDVRIKRIQINKDTFMFMQNRLFRRCYE